ncbi:MAG: hypothetical protein K2N01_12710 [Lachnospiraceae bacterium]|nr:hypothetical protein [Lachnospiraceae bacterium]
MKGTTLGRLQVVLGADSNPIMQTMRKVKGEMEAVAKAVRQQTVGIRKQTEEITAPMQEAMEPTRQLNEELQKIVNIKGSGRGLKDIQKDIERTEKKLRNLMNARDDLEFDGKHTEQTATFKQLQKEIAQAEQSLGKLYDKQFDLEDLGTDKEQTVAFKQLQKEIAETERSLKKLRAQKREMRDSGSNSEYTKEYKEALRLLEQEEGKLRQLEARRAKAQKLGGNAVRGAAWDGLNYDLEEKRNYVNAARNDIANMSDSEKYQNTERWTKTQSEIAKTEQRLASLKSQMESMPDTERYQNTEQWRRVQLEIDKTEQKLTSLMSKMESMPDSERYQNTDRWIKTQREIERTRVELAQLNAEQHEFNRTARVRRIPKVFTGLASTLKSLTSGIKRAGGTFASFIHKLKNGIPILNKTRSSMHGIGQTGKGLRGIFSTLGMTARFMVASFLIMGTLNGAKEGMQNLAQYSNKTNQSISLLYGGLISLKNALATAFSPILEVVTPYLDILITHLIEGANAISHFFAALTGSSTWTKAVKAQQDYAGSLNNTASAAAAAKRELYGFDEITKQSDDSAGGAAGAGGVAIGDMFTTEEVTNQFSDFAKKVKDAWKNADFTEIGNIVGEQLKKGLNKINWEGIKSQCNQIAKSIGTFINGFIQTEGLAESIGSTLGNAVNTGVSTAHTFFTTTDFMALGNFIAETANTFLETTDFDMLGRTVAERLEAGIDAWYGAVTTFSFEGLGSKIGTSITSWANDMNTVKKGMTGWQRLGVSISESVSGIVETIEKALETVPWEEIGQSIVDFVCAIEWGDLIWDLGEFAWAFLKAAVEAFKGIASELTGNGILSFWKLIGFADEDVSYQEVKEKTAENRSEIDAWLEKYPGLSESDYYNWKNGGKLPEHNPYGPLNDNRGKWEESVKKLQNDTSNSTNGLSSGVFGDIYGPESPKQSVKKSGLGYFEKAGKAVKNIAQGINTELGKTGLNIPIVTETSAKDLLNPMQKAFIKNPLKSQVATTNSGSDVHKSIQKGFANSGPFVTAAKTSNDGYFLFNALQSDFAKDELHTGAKADTTGSSIFRGIQNVFGENSYHAKAKSDTSGGSIFSGVQGTFGQGVFHTGARSDTSGDSVRQGLQRTFGASALSTWSTVTNSGADLRKGLQNTFGNSPLRVGVSLIRDGWNTVTEWVNGFFGSGSKPRGAAISKKANGGVFAGGSWHPVTAYASGGMPASGQFFMAREAGPELVGTIGGHTAVMNNNQIVASVSKGVYSATMAAMSQTMGGQKSGTPIEVHVHIGDKEVTDYVVKDINGRTLATGKCPIVT